MSLLFNTLSRLVIIFLPRSKCLLISWLQSPSAVILEPPKIKSLTVSTVSPSISHEVMWPDGMILVFWIIRNMFSRLHWHSCLINCCFLFRSEQLPPYSLQLVLLILFNSGVFLVKNTFLSPHASLHSGMSIKRMSQTLWVCENYFFFFFLISLNFCWRFRGQPRSDKKKTQ